MDSRIRIGSIHRDEPFLHIETGTGWSLLVAEGSQRLDKLSAHRMLSGSISETRGQDLGVDLGAHEPFEKFDSRSRVIHQAELGPGGCLGLFESFEVRSMPLPRGCGDSGLTQNLQAHAAFSGQFEPIDPSASHRSLCVRLSRMSKADRRALEPDRAPRARGPAGICV